MLSTTYLLSSVYSIAVFWARDRFSEMLSLLVLTWGLLFITAAQATRSIQAVFSMASSGTGTVRVLSRTVTITHGPDSRSTSSFYDADAVMSDRDVWTARCGLFTLTNCPTSNVSSFQTFLSKSFFYWFCARDINLFTSSFKASIRAHNWSCNARGGTSNMGLSKGLSWTPMLRVMVVVCTGHD